jgi:hypothetical protein
MTACRQVAKQVLSDLRRTFGFEFLRSFADLSQNPPYHWGLCDLAFCIQVLGCINVQSPHIPTLSSSLPPASHAIGYPYGCLGYVQPMLTHSHLTVPEACPCTLAYAEPNHGTAGQPPNRPAHSPIDRPDQPSHRSWRPLLRYLPITNAGAQSDCYSLVGGTLPWVPDR